MQAIWIVTFLQKLCTLFFIYVHLLILVRRQILRKHSCHILKKNCSIETFPNVSIILCIYPTLPVANTEGERDQGFIPLVESYQKTLKNGIRSFPAWRSAFRGGCGEQAGKFACCVLGQGTLRDAPPLFGRQVAHKSRKRQLPSECGHTVQSIAIQFAFS